MPTIPLMPASTTLDAGVAATNFIATMAGPVELVVGVFLAFLVVEILISSISGKNPAPVDNYDNDDGVW